MYNLDINFLNDRPIYQKKSEKRGGGVALNVGELTPMYIGVAVGVFFPALLATGWWFLQGQNTDLETSISQLDQENKALEVKIGDIKKIQAETTKIKGETQALVSVFDQIRPWSAMLQDLRDRIPAAVQIENVKQIAAPTSTTPTASSTPAPGQPVQNTIPSAGAVEISGMARTFNDVNDFILTLQRSNFFKPKETRIVSAELVDAPLPPNAASEVDGVRVKPPSVVKYTIQSTLSDVPASELIRELEQKGTVGLVARIRAMQQKGVLPR
jgi:type IV pilus assembly protein PilN